MYKLRFPRGLYGITPEWDDTNKLLRAIELAAHGGMVALQWRRKTASPKHAKIQAQQVIQLCKKLGVLGIINDDWNLALELNADGVHLGRNDASEKGILLARNELGPNKIIGVSCYNEIERARKMLALDVDYIAFGSMYSSSVKPNAVAASLNLLQQARALTLELAVQNNTLHNNTDKINKKTDQTYKQLYKLRAAVVAIGGISQSKIPELTQAGADSAAIISALFEASDIRDTAQQISNNFYIS